MALIQGHVMNGSKWVSLAIQIPGSPTALEVKNHWYSTLRSKMKSGKKPSLLYCYASICASSETKTREQRRVLLERAKEISDLADIGSAERPQTQSSQPPEASPFQRTSCPGFFRTSEGFHYHSGSTIQSEVTTAAMPAAPASASTSHQPSMPPCSTPDFFRASVGSEASMPPPRTSCPGFFRTSEGFHYHSGSTIHSASGNSQASACAPGSQFFARPASTGGFNPFNRVSNASTDSGGSQFFARVSGGSSNAPCASFNRVSYAPSDAGGSQLFARVSGGFSNRVDAGSGIVSQIGPTSAIMSRVPEEFEDTMALLEHCSLDPMGSLALDGTFAQECGEARNGAPSANVRAL